MLPPPSQFRQSNTSSCQQFTPNTERLTFTNRAVLICTAASPLFTVLSVPDTRTTFNYCCSFNTLNPELNPICHLLALLGAYHILHVSRIRVNWKRTTNGNFVLSIITWVLDIGELLGSRPGRLIPGEGGNYYPAGCLGRRASLDVLEDAEFSRPYRY